MRFPIFASFIVFLVFFYISTNRAERKNRANKQSYWEREQKANSVRRQSLDNLDYIVISYDTFPMAIADTEETIKQCLRELNELASEKIVNLTGLTNTDLKLEYGAANISLLSRYDQNFTILVRILQTWAERLNELGYQNEALQVLEFAISNRTDISGSYYLAAKLYTALGNPEKISYLKRTADTLQSAMRNSIVRTLQESYPDIDPLHS